MFDGLLHRPLHAVEYLFEDSGEVAVIGVA
jgi:hypothetical protein